MYALNIFILIMLYYSIVNFLNDTGKFIVQDSADSIPSRNVTNLVETKASI